MSHPPKTSKFPTTIRRYPKNKHYLSGAVETVWCEEKEFPPGTPDGHYQLWVEDVYVQDITTEVEKRHKKDLPNAMAMLLAQLEEHA